jgi:hypothetical protein
MTCQAPHFRGPRHVTPKFFAYKVLTSEDVVPVTANLALGEVSAVTEGGRGQVAHRTQDCAPARALRAPHVLFRHAPRAEHVTAPTCHDMFILYPHAHIHTGLRISNKYGSVR